MRLSIFLPHLLYTCSKFQFPTYECIIIVHYYPFIVVELISLIVRFFSSVAIKSYSIILEIGQKDGTFINNLLTTNEARNKENFERKKPIR